jgi:hypothetical protein
LHWRGAGNCDDCGDAAEFLGLIRYVQSLS